MESFFAFDDIIFILYILAFAEQIHDLITLMMLELNTFPRYVKRKPKYNLVYDFEILFMRLRLTLKTPSMLRIWIELIFNNTTSQTTTKLDFLLKHPELFQFIDGMRTIYFSIECRNAAIYLFLNFYSLHLLIQVHCRIVPIFFIHI